MRCYWCDLYYSHIARVRMCWICLQYACLEASSRKISRLNSSIANLSRESLVKGEWFVRTCCNYHTVYIILDVLLLWCQCRRYSARHFLRLAHKIKSSFHNYSRTVWNNAHFNRKIYYNVDILVDGSQHAALSHLGINMGSESVHCKKHHAACLAHVVTQTYLWSQSKSYK